MGTFVQNIDGGKTNQEGHYRLQTKVWTGNVLSGLTVSQSGTLGMSVVVAEGDLKIDYNDYGFSGWNDADSTVTIATSDVSNPRIDRVVAYVDLGMTPQTVTPNNPGFLKFKAVAGTPAGSPSRPSDGTVQTAVGSGNPFCDLADVAVAAGVTTISNGNITDKRALLQIGTSQIANAAVTPDKWTNPYMFSVYRSAAQNTTANTAVPVLCDTALFDRSSNVDLVTNKGRFTAPVTGYYHFDGAATAVLNGTAALGIDLYKNSSLLLQGNQISSTSASSAYGSIVTVSALVYLVAGDYIESYVICNATTSLIVGAQNAYFNGHLVSK